MGRHTIAWGTVAARNNLLTQACPIQSKQQRTKIASSKPGRYQRQLRQIQHLRQSTMGPGRSERRKRQEAPCYEWDIVGAPKVAQTATEKKPAVLGVFGAALAAEHGKRAQLVRSANAAEDARKKTVTKKALSPQARSTTAALDSRARSPRRSVTMQGLGVDVSREARDVEKVIRRTRS